MMGYMQSMMGRIESRNAIMAAEKAASSEEDVETVTADGKSTSSAGATVRNAHQNHPADLNSDFCSDPFRFL